MKNALIFFALFAFPAVVFGAPPKAELLSYGYGDVTGECLESRPAIKATLNDIGSGGYLLDFTVPERNAVFMTVFPGGSTDSSESCQLYALVRTNIPAYWLFPKAHLTVFKGAKQEEATGQVSLTIKNKLDRDRGAVLAGNTHLVTTHGISQLIDTNDDEIKYRCATEHFFTFDITYKVFPHEPVREFYLTHGPSITAYASSNDCPNPTHN